MALWENWDVDFIAKRAYPLSLPPLRSKRSTEDQGPLKDKRLKALLDVAPDRAMHQKSLRILHNVSDATSPQTSDQELLYRLREYVGRKRGAFDYTLLNDYVFQIRRCKKTVVKCAPKHKIKKLKSSVSLSLIHKGGFGVKQTLEQLADVEWNTTQHGNVPTNMRERHRKVRQNRTSLVASSSTESLQKAMLKQIYPHVRLVRMSQIAQQRAWLTFIKIAMMRTYTQEALQTDRLKRIFRSKTTGLIIKVQRKCM